MDLQALSVADALVVIGANAGRVLSRIAAGVMLAAAVLVLLRA